MRGLGSNILSVRPDSTRHMKRIANVKSVDFDGSDDGLTIEDHDDFSPTDGSNNDKPFSISMWVKNHDSGNTHGLLFGKGTYTATKEYKLFNHYGTLMFDIVDNSDSTYKRVAAPAQTLNNPHNTWYHIIATYDGSETADGLKIYKDGELLSLTASSAGSYAGIPNANSKVAIGHRLDNSHYDWNGPMTDIMWWKDYCLSQTEIDQIYNNGQFSVDPTVNTGDYTGASYCKLWLKCNAQLTISEASSTTVYQIVAEAKGCPGELIQPSNDLYEEHCGVLEGAGAEGTICCATTESTPAVYGLQDFSGNNHNATFNGNGVTLVVDIPTADGISFNEYTNNF